MMNQLTVSLWGDESFSVEMAKRSFGDIIHITSHDTAPPLYYFFLHFWIKFFGLSEVSVRSFSLILFIGVILAVYFLSKQLFNKKIAYIASILTCINPILFLYAFETRMYMLFVLATILSMLFFYQKKWLAYSIVTLTALYTHYFSFFMIATQILYYLILEGEKFYKQKQPIRDFLKRQVSSPFIVSLLAIGVGYIPWILVFLSQTKSVSGDFWLSSPKSLQELFVLYAHFIAGSTGLFIQLYVVLASIVLLSIRKCNKEKDLLLYLWLFFPPIITFFYSLIGRPIFFDRYLVPCILPLPILLASAYQREWFSFKQVRMSKCISSILLVFIVTSLTYITTYVFTHPTKQPFRELSTYSITHYGKHTPIINYYTNYLHYFELKYNGVNVKIYSAHPLPLWVGKALITPSDILAAMPDEKRLIIMASGDIGQIYLPAYHIIEEHQFNNLYLFVYEKI